MVVDSSGRSARSSFSLLILGVGANRCVVVSPAARWKVMDLRSAEICMGLGLVDERCTRRRFEGCDDDGRRSSGGILNVSLRTRLETTLA